MVYPPKLLAGIGWIILFAAALAWHGINVWKRKRKGKSKR